MNDQEQDRPQPVPAQEPSIPAPIGPFPLSLGLILDRIAGLMRGHLRLLAGVAALPSALLVLVVFVPVGLLQFWQFRSLLHGQPPVPQTLPAPPPQSILALLAVMAVASLCGLVLFALYSAAGCHAALSADAGIRLTIRDCYRLARERAGRYIGLMLAMYLCILAPLLAVLLSVALAGLLTGVMRDSTAAAFFLIPLAILGVAGGYIWAIVLMLRLALAFPAAVAEDLPAWQAIRRTGQLTRGAKGRIFAVMLIVYAVTYILNMAAMALLFALASLSVAAGTVFHLPLHSPLGYAGAGLVALLWLAAMFLWIALPWAIVTTAQCVLYRDQRLRIDGVALPTAP
jgi:hypothetical protein